MFLIYRVELKVRLDDAFCKSKNGVPNLPCGVESSTNLLMTHTSLVVPNLPCGVESFAESQGRMHLQTDVPNLPCGVESYLITHLLV